MIATTARRFHICLAAGLITLCVGCSAQVRRIPETPPIKAGAEVTNPVKATIHVDIKGSEIVVHARYQNISKLPIFIRKGLFGVATPEQDKASIRGALDEFVIRAPDGRYLQYGGLLVNFVLGDTKETNFLQLDPDVVMTSSISLGPAPAGPHKGHYNYHFLPGANTYEIVALYKVFDEEENVIKTLRTEPSTFTFTLPDAKQ